MSTREEPVPIEELLAHREWLSRLARALVSDPQVAADLTQEAWLRALRRPPRHRRGLRGWLATILRNVARDEGSRRAGERRRAERAPRPEAPESPAAIAAGEAPGGDGAHGEAVGRAIEWLLAREEIADPFAARALAEAYARTRDPRCREAAIDALERLDPDDPQAAITGAIARVSCVPARPGPAAPGSAGADPTVEAALARLLSGEPAWVDDGLRRTCVNLPDRRPADTLAFHDLVLAAFQAGAGVWRDTNAILRERLATRQDGFAAESSADAALLTATLAVYFRYPRLVDRAR